MKKEDFMQALELLSSNHTTKITINQAVNHFVGDLGEKKWSIHITECCPAVVKKLTDAGYSLGMSEYGLSVDKY